MDGLSNSEYALASSIELSEFVSSPRLGFGIVVSEVGQSSVRAVSLLDGPLVASVDVVMEGVFEGNGVVLLSSLDSHNEGTNNGLVGSPGVGDKPGSVEESWPDNVGLEVLLDSSFLHLPANNLNVAISIISDLKLVESVTVPVVALGNVPVVEVVVDIVVVTKVIGGREPKT